MIEQLASGELNQEALMETLYPDFRNLAAHYLRGERTGHTLQTTALVNEAFIRLTHQEKVDWKGKTHFLAVGAKMMRRILVDHARKRARLKRGGSRIRVQFDEAFRVSSQKDEDLLEVDEALENLAVKYARQTQIVEMRFFGGMKMEEIAESLGMSKRWVEREWQMIRAWLRRESTESGENE